MTKAEQKQEVRKHTERRGNEQGKNRRVESENGPELGQAKANMEAIELLKKERREEAKRAREAVEKDDLNAGELRFLLACLQACKDHADEEDFGVSYEEVLRKLVVTMEAAEARAWAKARGE